MEKKNSVFKSLMYKINYYEKVFYRTRTDKINFEL